MRFEKVLLINPLYQASHWGPVRPPAGIGYISEMLTSGNIGHRVMDIPLRYGKKDLFNMVDRFRPGLIGISLLTYRYKDSYNLIRDLKERFPSATLIAGGPHVTMLNKKIFEDMPYIDFCIAGEAEVSLMKFIQGDALSQIPGLIFRRDGGISCNSSSFIEELDSLPFPRYRKFPLRQYVAKEIGIITSRGCPYNCIFCQETLGKKFRIRSPGPVVDELDYWAGEGYRDILILDDNFTMDGERATAICEGIKKKNLDLNLRLANGVRADRINKNLLLKMRESGFRYISFGVEAGNDRVLEAIGKAETVADIKKAVSMAIETGFEVTLFFLVGSPLEKTGDVEDSVALAREFPVFDARFYNLIPFPGTRLYDWVEKRDFFLERPEVYLNRASHWDSSPVFATPWFDRRERRHALVYTKKMRRRIRRCAIKRRLKRFSPLNGVAGWIFSLDVVQNILQTNRFFRRTLQEFFEAWR